MRYDHLNEVSELLMAAVAARSTRAAKSQGKRRLPGTWWPLLATCIEYQTESGDCRSVALLGGSARERSAHGYALAQCKTENGLLSDGFTCVRVDSHTAISTTTRLLWSPALAATFHHLLPYLATSPLIGLDFDKDIAEALRGYRNAAELTRAIDGGSFAEALCNRLADRLASASDARSLIDPRELLGTDRHPEQSQLTDLIHCIVEADSSFVVRKLPPGDFIARSAPDIAGLSGSFAQSIARKHQTLLGQLFERGVRPVLLNTRLGIPDTQFCLRHFLEGRSDFIQVLTPASFGDRERLRALRLEEWSGAGAGDPGATERCFVHGPRRIELVSFERQGRVTELVAFDPSVDGYARVRSVWPGQVADFFSRHAGLRVRELIMDMRDPRLKK